MTALLMEKTGKVNEKYGAIKEELLKYVDRDLYDIKGFVDYQKLTNRLGIKAVKLARAAGKTQRALQKNPYSEKIQDKLRKIVYIIDQKKAYTQILGQAVYDSKIFEGIQYPWISLRVLPVLT